MNWRFLLLFSAFVPFPATLGFWFCNEALMIAKLGTLGAAVFFALTIVTFVYAFVQCDRVLEDIGFDRFYQMLHVQEQRKAPYYRIVHQEARETRMYRIIVTYYPWRPYLGSEDR